MKEAVAVIRQDVAAVASYLGANEETVERIRLAVSEAATNIVQNVFEHTSGRINVALRGADRGQIAVSVSDDGKGAAPRNLEAGLGLGFVVMRECADTLKLRRPISGGVEVEMLFAARPASGEDGAAPAGEGARVQAARPGGPQLPFQDAAH
jgi:anti-sigma regulatory factor (Ser/Thr protein kinase)